MIMEKELPFTYYRDLKVWEEMYSLYKMMGLKDEEIPPKPNPNKYKKVMIFE